MTQNECPYCHAKAIEVTTSEDTARYFLCTGPEQHRFTWEHEVEADEEPPLIILAKD